MLSPVNTTRPSGKCTTIWTWVWPRRARRTS